MRTLTSLMFLLCALLLSTTALGNKLPRLPPGVEYGSEYYKPGEGRTSQLGADHWVSHMFADEEDKPKYYVDCGAHNPKFISNSYQLDQLGWRGICIEPNPSGDFAERTCTLERRAVDDVAGKAVKFRIAGPVGGLEKSMSENHKRVHKSGLRDSKVVEVETDTLANILDRNEAPRFIEYLSLDIEGAEFHALQYFPFWKYEFGAITVEHNHEEPRRSCLKKLLESNGYSLAMSVDFDDWYVRNITQERPPVFDC